MESYDCLKLKGVAQLNVARVPLRHSQSRKTSERRLDVDRDEISFSCLNSAECGVRNKAGQDIWSECLHEDSPNEP